ncbi:hypothetical protein PUN28_016357 [Cardiocondyla obscurior]|uniref:Uncharacterized protein n=1 Tax=Cardiocondyla obscurior TaxID=286306 RepID=A0AAW2EVZ4_9HYME
MDYHPTNHNKKSSSRRLRISNIKIYLAFKKKLNQEKKEKQSDDSHPGDFSPRGTLSVLALPRRASRVILRVRRFSTSLSRVVATLVLSALEADPLVAPEPRQPAPGASRALRRIYQGALRAMPLQHRRDRAHSPRVVMAPPLRRSISPLAATTSTTASTAPSTASTAAATTATATGGCGRCTRSRQRSVTAGAATLVSPRPRLRSALLFSSLLTPPSPHAARREGRRRGATRGDAT